MLLLNACTDVTEAPTPDAGDEVAWAPPPDGTTGTMWVRMQGVDQEITYVVHRGHRMYQGDIDYGPVPHPGSDRARAVAGQSTRWPNGIVNFTFETDFDFSLVPTIQAAMRMWTSRVPNLQFVPGHDPNRPHIVFANSSEAGVSSSNNIGVVDFWQLGMVNTIELSSGVGANSVSHELGHALGFAHEAVRHDRDSAVLFSPQCVDDDHIDQFEPSSGSWFDVFAYDTHSMMQYPSTNFCITQPNSSLCACLPLLRRTAAVPNPNPFNPTCNDPGQSNTPCPANPAFISRAPNPDPEDTRAMGWMYELPMAPLAPNNNFGAAFAGGDFDGDGFEDLIVGAPGENSVFVYRGSEAGLHGMRHIVESDISSIVAANDRFGQALAVGDFNGDDVDDLAIGAPHGATSTSPNVPSGVVYVIYGRKDIGLDMHHVVRVGQGLTPTPIQAEAGFGTTLAAGNLDGARGDELAVGSPSQTLSTGQKSGWVNTFTFDTKIFIDNPNSTTSPTNGAPANYGAVGMPASSGPANGDQFGIAIAIANFDDSGAADLAIGAPGSGSGKVFIYTADTSANHFAAGVPLVQLAESSNTSGASGADAPTSADRFGAAIVFGDFDNAHYAATGRRKHELAIGAPGKGNPTSSGRIFTMIPSVNSSTGALSWSQQTMFGEPGTHTLNDSFGRRMAVVPTTGNDDLIVGVQLDNANGSQSGTDFRFVGSASGLKTSSGFDMTAGNPFTGPGDQFGNAVLVGAFDPLAGDLTVITGMAGANQGGGTFTNFNVHQPEVFLVRDETSAFPLVDHVP